MPIKCLILDYGGVYSYKYVAGSFNDALAVSTGHNAMKFDPRLIEADVDALGMGKIDSREFLRRVGRRLNVDKPIDRRRFETAVVAGTHMPDPTLTEMVRDLRSRGVKVGLLSDMSTFELNATRPTGRFEGFDFTYFSSEIGYTKRWKECFAYVLSLEDLEPSMTLFVDDSARNSAIAREVGIQVLHAKKSKYTTAESLAVEILRRVSASTS